MKGVMCGAQRLVRGRFRELTSSIESAGNYRHRQCSDTCRGVLSKKLNGQIFKHGFSFPSAHTGFVTLGGYLLGGGMEHARLGMACGSVLAAWRWHRPSRTPICTGVARSRSRRFWPHHGRQAAARHTTPKILKNAYFFTLDKVEAAVAECLRLLPASKFRTEVLGAMGKVNPPCPSHAASRIQRPTTCLGI